MRISKKHLLNGLIIVSLLGLSVQANAMQTITLAQNLAPISGITIIAKAKGYFHQEGLNVKVRNLTSGKVALDTVLGGAADFATVAETPLMRAALANQPIAIIATMESSNNDVKLIVSSDDGIDSISDLKGKKIATFVGTSAQFFLVKALATAHLKPTDVEVINLNPSDMPTALARGDVAGYAIWEPNVYKGEELMGKKAKILSTRGIYVETFNIAVMKPYLEKHPKVVTRFLKALLIAEKYIKEHPSKSISIIANATGMKRVLFEKIRPDFNYKVELKTSLLKYIDEEAAWDISTGRARPGSGYMNILKEMIVAGPLRRLDPSRVVGY